VIDTLGNITALLKSEKHRQHTRCNDGKQRWIHSVCSFSTRSSHPRPPPPFDMLSSARPWSVPSAPASARGYTKDAYGTASSGNTTPLPGVQPSSSGTMPMGMPMGGSTVALPPPTAVSAAPTGGRTVGDLDELYRQYRLMELTRRAAGGGGGGSEDGAHTLRMQRQQIEKLKKDGERIKEDLALETRQARQANNMSAAAQIAKLQDQGEMYTRKIESERRRLEELDKQIKKLQTSLLLQRKEQSVQAMQAAISSGMSTSGAGAWSFDVDRSASGGAGIQKQIRILENRLDKALVKFNEALAHNKNLRESIDNLRRERQVFEGIYGKLARELSKKKSDMIDVMKEIHLAYENRAAAQREMVHLKQAADREQERFEMEWKNLANMVERERRLKNGTGTGTGTSSGGSTTPSSTLMMALPPGSSHGHVPTTGTLRMLRLAGSSTLGADPNLELESQLRKRVTQGAWGIASDKANIHLSMEKVQAYEEAFAKIQKATKITDIDALVNHFLQAEDTNFSLFNYVNDLSNEIDRVEEQIEKVRQERKRYKTGRRNGADNTKDGEDDDEEEEKTSTALVPFSGSYSTQQDEVVVGSAALLAATTGNSIMSDRSSKHEHEDGEGGHDNEAGRDKAIIQTGAGSRADRARKQMLVDLDSKLRHHHEISHRYQQHIQESSRTLHTLKQGIAELFATLDCAKLPGAELLGNAGVTEGNLMQHLAFIEQATNGLVGNYRKQWNEENNHNGGGSTENNNNNWDANTAIHANQQFQFQHSPQHQQSQQQSSQQQPRPPSSSQSTSRPGSHDQGGFTPAPTMAAISIRAPSASGPDDEDGNADGGHADDEIGMNHLHRSSTGHGHGHEEDGSEDEDDEQPIDPDELIRQQRQQSRQSARRQMETQEE